MPSYSDLPLYVLAAFWALIAIALAFLAFFCLPAIRTAARLRGIQKAVEAAVPGSDLTRIFEGQGSLQHLWNEFRETLHEERAYNAATASNEVVALRATLPAETYFTQEVIVDTPLRSEFFKHLPGIFTGIGIIGTFTGLIIGLSAFKVSDSAEAVRESLNNLLRGVYDAFLVSALAIALAMLVTFIEKLVLVALYRRVQSLTQSIDERYKSGVGEEYLARLVTASEESATQSKILKDALVTDLRGILTELTERQIAAHSNANAQLVQQIGQSLGEGIKAPLDRIASAVNAVGKDQGAAVQQLLADVMSGFAAKMEGLFGGQMTGIQEMQQQTIRALQEAVGQLQTMSTAVEGAGQRASEAMAERLTEALQKLDSRQHVMNEEMRKFVAEIRASVGQTQSESQAHLQTLLAGLAEQAQGLVSSLSTQTAQVVGSMGSQAEGLTRIVAEAAAKTAEAVSKLEAVTSSAIGDMNSASHVLADSARAYAAAGQGMGAVLTRAEGLTSQLVQASSALASSSRSLEGVVAEYRTTRDAVTQMLGSVQATVEAARREASLTADVLQRIEASSAKLATAQRAADEYLGGVTQVLAESHQAFADTMARTVESGNTSFYEAVTRATKLLSSSIMELEAVVGSAAIKPSARARS